MISVNLVQGSPEWHLFRNSRIGASDFAVIAGNAGLCTNMFKTSINTLIKNKINNIQKADNIYFATGRAYEKPLLDSLKMDLICGEVISYPSNERIYSSLDARDLFSNVPVEIKTTSKSQSKIEELIEYYSFQVAHQCYTLGSKEGLLVIGLLDDTKEIIKIVKRNIVAKKIINKTKWLELCNDFLDRLDMANQAPEEILAIYNTYELLKAQSDKIKIQMEKAKNKLCEVYPNGCAFAQFSINKHSKISYKYSDYIKDNKIELSNKYRNESIVYTLKGNKSGKAK